MTPLFLPLVPGAGPAGGPRFALLHRPPGPPRGLVVYAHPFAEEMNKSRRMAALQARAMAAAGYAVLQPDLLGCGDSAGDFGDATWTAWVEDIVQACHWLRNEAKTWAAQPQIGVDADAPPLTLWGLRAGTLLATEAATRLGNVHCLLLWQPTPSGKPLLHQFLRLQMAGDLMGAGARGGTEALRSRLAAGETVELAGYRLSPSMAQGLEQARLAPAAGVRSLHWLELSTREDATLAPASASTVAAWRQSGCDVRTHLVRGPAFWQTTEIEDAPDLIRTTLSALDESATAPRRAAVPA